MKTVTAYAFILALFLFAHAALARMDDSGPQGPTPRLSPQQILSGIYQPWTGALHELEKTLHKDRNYLVWIHVPAQHPMDLRSSEMFRRWAIATPFTELTISHNMVAFRCRNKEGQMVTGATGMTGSSSLQEVAALLDGYGLSIFFSTYTDGHLNPEREVGDYINKNLVRRGAIFGGFEVSNEQCDSMRDYLSAFVHHPRRPFERFNNIGDPEKFEGGGCVTFAVTLLKKAGLLDTVIPSFYRTFSVARYLFGGNLWPVKKMEPYPTPWLKGARYSIPLSAFWNRPWNAVPVNFPEYVHLRQIDPEKMVYTLQQFAKVYLEGQGGSMRAREAKWLSTSTLGTRISVSANNLLGGPWKYSRTPINDSFDPQMAETGRIARSWFRAKVKDGYRIRLNYAVGMPVLLLERN